MQVHKCVPMAAIGLLLHSMAFPQDQLTPAVTAELAAQCAAPPGYQSCVSALRYHGLGKDDDAMEVLLSYAPAGAGERYKIARTKPKDGFWKLVATAGAVPTNCNAGLSAELATHFGLSPKALADAADDSSKNNFLALADLLVVPAGAPANWIPSVQVYRFCFSDPDHLFTEVKKTLGRSQ